jgi:hypothetical protein
MTKSSSPSLRIKVSAESSHGAPILQN